MTDNCFAIALVHGIGAADHASALQAHYSATRAATDTDDLQNGDLLLRDDDQEGLDWTVASNVLLLPDRRAPIVRKIALADALAAVGFSPEDPPS